MAYGAKKIFPIDTKPGTAVGVSIPFNSTSVFFQTYTTQVAIKNNLINLLLTNRSERFLNNRFGANLKKFIFEMISSQTLFQLKDRIQSIINIYYPSVKVSNINVDQFPDTNEIQIQIYYDIIDTGISDNIQITFS